MPTLESIFRGDKKRPALAVQEKAENKKLKSYIKNSRKNFSTTNNSRQQDLENETRIFATKNKLNKLLSNLNTSYHRNTDSDLPHARNKNFQAEAKQQPNLGVSFSGHENKMSSYRNVRRLVKTKASGYNSVNLDGPTGNILKRDSRGSLVNR